MSLFKSLEFYAYTAFAAGVSAWAAHNPVWHDPAIWLLGVLGHAIGYANHQKVTNGTTV